MFLSALKSLWSHVKDSSWSHHLLSFLIAVLVHAAHPSIALFVLAWIAAEVVLKVFIFLHKNESVLNTICADYLRNPDAFLAVRESNVLLSRFEFNSLVLRLNNDSNPGWIFDSYFRQRTTEFRENMRLFQEGCIVEPMPKISPLSEELPERLQSSAFCTAIEANLEDFVSGAGRDLFRRYHHAARRFPEPGQFVRVYIVKDFRRIKWNHFCLMREDHESGVNVRIIKEAEANLIVASYPDLFRGMDFGLWDNLFLMVIRPGSDKGDVRSMLVSRKEQDLANARSIRDKILKSGSALSWTDFYSAYTSPINDWSSQYQGSLIRLPASNGPSEGDCSSFLKSIQRYIQKDGASDVALLGLTGPLLDSIKDLESKKYDVRNVFCVDARPLDVSESAKYSNVSFVSSSWLSWRIPSGNSRPLVVFGDDVLANFSIGQLPLFFEHLKRNILAPDGVAIFRTSAMYSDDLAHPTFEEALDFLRQFDKLPASGESEYPLNLLTSSAVYEVAWPVLHSSRFYDDEASSFNFSEWNRLIDGSTLSSGLKARLRQVPVLDIRMTSPKFSDLRELASPHFKYIRPSEVESVWASTPLSAVPGSDLIATRFRRYYMLLVFESSAFNHAAD